MHQATFFMLDHLRVRLNLAEEQMPLAMQDYGNTVSSTLPVLMHDLRAAGRLRPGTQPSWSASASGFPGPAALDRDLAAAERPRGRRGAWRYRAAFGNRRQGFSRRRAEWQACGGCGRHARRHLTLVPVNHADHDHGQEPAGKRQLRVGVRRVKRVPPFMLVETGIGMTPKHSPSRNSHSTCRAPRTWTEGRRHSRLSGKPSHRV